MKSLPRLRTVPDNALRGLFAGIDRRAIWVDRRDRAMLSVNSGVYERGSVNSSSS